MLLERIEPEWPKGEAARGLVPRLIHAIPTERAAVGLLERIDPDWGKSKPAQEAVPRLVCALPTNEWVRGVLGWIDPEWDRGEAAWKAVPDLIAMLGGRDAQVRTRAVRVLIQITDEDFGGDVGKWREWMTRRGGAEGFTTQPCRRLSAEAKRQVTTWLTMAQALLQAKRYDKCAEYCRKVLDLAPNGSEFEKQAKTLLAECKEAEKRSD
ncbi:MAG: hypothetical protein AMS14_09485 [Planctomycetes bacterium DG_20]|nr:MAG: hypothetical protein AMS14_09485 [Planctomycetes bacterium DG_20]